MRADSDCTRGEKRSSYDYSIHSDTNTALIADLSTDNLAGLSVVRRGKAILRHTSLRHKALLLSGNASLLRQASAVGTGSTGRASRHTSGGRIVLPSLSSLVLHTRVADT